MGNVAGGGGGVRDYYKSGYNLPPPSPWAKGNVNISDRFTFDKRQEMDSIDYPQMSRPETVSEEEGEKLQPTVFKWDGGGQSAFICGTFSDWKTIPMFKGGRDMSTAEDQDFVAIVELPEGEHYYKFLIDGEWRYNASEPNSNTENGTMNYIITVSEADFEVFDALLDEDIVEDNRSNSPKSKMTQSGCGSVPKYNGFRRSSSSADCGLKGIQGVGQQLRSIGDDFERTRVRRTPRSRSLSLPTTDTETRAVNKNIDNKPHFTVFDALATTIGHSSTSKNLTVNPNCMGDSADCGGLNQLNGIQGVGQQLRSIGDDYERTHLTRPKFSRSRSLSFVR